MAGVLFALLALIPALDLPASPASPPLVIVDVDADAAARCDAGRRLLHALRLRLPGLRAGAHRRARRGDLRVVLVPGDAVSQLTVYRADASVALTRSLALPAADCDNLVSTAALVLDRFLTELDWPGLRDRPTLGQLAAAPATGVTAEAPPPLPAPPDRAFDLTAALISHAAWGRAQTLPGGTLSVGLSGATWRVQAGLRGQATRSRTVVLAEGETSETLGQIETLPLAVLLGLERCFGDAVRVCPGLNAGARVTLARASGGALYREQGQVGVRPTLGAALSFVYTPPGWALGVVGAVTADASPWPAAFAVDGLEDPVYRDARVELGAGIGVRFTFH